MEIQSNKLQDLQSKRNSLREQIQTQQAEIKSLQNALKAIEIKRINLKRALVTLKDRMETTQHLYKSIDRELAELDGRTKQAKRPKGLQPISINQNHRIAKEIAKLRIALKDLPEDQRESIIQETIKTLRRTKP